MERAVSRATHIATATAFLVAVAVVPWWVNYATAPKWAVLSLGVPLAVAFLQPRYTRTLALLGATLLLALLSGLWTTSTPDWAQEVWAMALLVGAFAIGQAMNDRQAHGVYLALACGLAVSVLVSAVHLAGHPLLPTADGRPAGLFYNTNLFGEVLFPTLAVLGWSAPVLGLLLLAGAATAALRSGLVGAGTAGLVLLVAYRKWALAAAAVALAIAALAALTAQKGWDSIFVRLDVWRVVAGHVSWYSHGAGSFFADGLGLAQQAPASMQYSFLRARLAHPHNELLLYAYELGIGALPLFLVFARALIGKVTHERLAFIVLFVEGLFGFPFHVPATLFLGGILMGRLCGHGRGVRRGPDLSPEYAIMGGHQARRL